MKVVVRGELVAVGIITQLWAEVTIQLGTGEAIVLPLPINEARECAKALYRKVEIKIEVEEIEEHR